MRCGSLRERRKSGCDGAIRRPIASSCPRALATVPSALVALRQRFATGGRHEVRDVAAERRQLLHPVDDRKLYSGEAMM